MTYREKLKQDKPSRIDDKYYGGVMGCPYMYGYEDKSACKDEDAINDEAICRACWNREMPEESEE